MSASRASALVCAGLAALTGCSAPAEPAPPRRVEATAELRQSRSDALRGLVQVTVTTRVPLDLTSVRLRSDAFATLPPSPLDVDLPAGARTDLPTSYGAADCDSEPTRAEALLTVRGTEGERELRVPLDGLGLLRRLHDGACFDQRLAEAARLSATTAGPARPGPGRPSLPLRLTVERQGGAGEVAVTDLGAHVVFTVRSDRQERPLLTLSPEDRSADLAVELTPSRCEAHALAENKRMSVLGVYVALDGGEPRLVTVTPDPSTRAALEDFAVEGCGA